MLPVLIQHFTKQSEKQQREHRKTSFFQSVLMHVLEIAKLRTHQKTVFLKIFRDSVNYRAMKLRWQ